jgi:hypothetical protein
MTRAEIDILVRGLGDLLDVLRRADPRDRAELYRQLGLELVYQPERRTVTTEARPAVWAYGRVGGGT